MERENVEQKAPVLFLLKCLLFSYILTAVLLLLLTFLLYKFGLTEQIVSIAIIAIYVIATFGAGFIAGKRIQNRKFLWGLLLGVAYFLVLVIVSILVKRSPGELGDSVMTTFVLCSAGGMLGGMLS